MIGAALGDQIHQMFKITGPGPWPHIFGRLYMVDGAVPVTVPWSPAPCSSPPSWWQFWSRWIRCTIPRASECGVRVGSGVRCSKVIGRQCHGNSGWMDISGSRVSLPSKVAVISTSTVGVCSQGGDGNEWSSPVTPVIGPYPLLMCARPTT
jgi:hypothetical protein